MMLFIVRKLIRGEQQRCDRDGDYNMSNYSTGYLNKLTGNVQTALFVALLAPDGRSAHNLKLHGDSWWCDERFSFVL
jgi:hypothetical protein